MSSLEPIESDENILNIIQKTIDITAQGHVSIQASCSYANNNQSNDIQISCHQTHWSPLLLACLAAEGVEALHINGLNNCSTCPHQQNEHTLQSTIEEYDTLNTALAMKLSIKLEPLLQLKPIATENTEPEPSRRTFFRKIIPTVVKHAADTVQQVTQTGKTIPDVKQEINADKRLIPTLSKAFFRALPRLHVNHLPIPVLQSIALGNIQIDDSCTACGECVTTCSSQALSMKAFGQNKILEFKSDCCTGCNLCVQICPEQSIQALPSINLPSLLQDKTRPLIMVHQSKIRN